MFVPAASLVQSFAQSSECVFCFVLADIAQNVNCTRTTNADRHKLTAVSKGLSECKSVTCVVEKGEGNIIRGANANMVREHWMHWEGIRCQR